MNRITRRHRHGSTLNGCAQLLVLCWCYACDGKDSPHADTQTTPQRMAADADGGTTLHEAQDAGSEPSVADAAAPSGDGAADPIDASETPMAMTDSAVPSMAMSDAGVMPPHMQGSAGVTAPEVMPPAAGAPEMMPNAGSIAPSDMSGAGMMPHEAMPTAGSAAPDMMPTAGSTAPDMMPTAGAVAPDTMSDAGVMPPAAGSGGMMPPEPMPSAGSAGLDSMAGAGAMAPAEPDGGMPMIRCPMHPATDPRDETAATTPTTIRVGFSRDLVLPQAMLDWMTEGQLEQAHIGWHLVRRWDQLCKQSFAAVDTCDSAKQLVADQLWRADVQEAAPGSGLAFLAMHRHMIMMLTAAFPKHSAMLAGFAHAPQTTDDSENPTPWKALRWTQDNLQGFDVLEHIEDHLAQFPSDDDLGRYIETTINWTPENPAEPSGLVGAGVHAALHNQWSVSGSPADLGQFDTAPHNYIFWKLHGFIDEVWSRYRRAKGLSDDDPVYMKALDDECYGMYLLQPLHRGEFTPSTGGH